MSRRGRPKIEIPENIVNEIIYRYSKERKTSGKIKYMDVFHFSNELFRKKEINYEISEFFWRKGEGRNLIDKANEVITHSISSTNENLDETVIDTEDAVNKFYSGKKQDKEKLIGVLKINEQKLKQYIKRNSRTERQLSESKDQVRILKEKNDNLNQQLIEYENKLFEWLELSNSKNIPLFNLLTTGSSRTTIVEDLLKSIFSDNPLDIFDRLKLKSTNEPLTASKIEGKTVSYNEFKKEKQKSVLDDINF
jgi:hypothetical protein